MKDRDNSLKAEYALKREGLLALSASRLTSGIRLACSSCCFTSWTFLFLSSVDSEALPSELLSEGRGSTTKPIS
jgi:hypothetical protein